MVEIILIFPTWAIGNMIHNSDIIAFCFAVFIALSFTGAGIYLSDELSPANQLHQIGQLHQVTYHEGKYGFYNDSVDKSITGANYVMTYPLMLPIISLPVYVVAPHLQDASRLVPLIFWILLALIIVRYTALLLHEKYRMYLYGAFAAFIVANILYYVPFSTDNIEVLSIVLTNVILYGLFSAVVWKTTCLLFVDKARIFAWVVTMSCSSLLFWVGALKDHVLVASLFMVIVYSMMKFDRTNDRVYLIISGVISGLLIWERPELSIVVLPIIVGYILYKYRKYFINPMFVFSFFTAVGLLPLVMNNLIVTGSMSKFPYQAVNQTLGGVHLITSTTIYDVLLKEIPLYIINNISKISLDSIYGLFIMPANGGLGLMPILMLSIITIIFLSYYMKYKNISLMIEEKIGYIFSAALIFVYLFTSYLGFNLHAEMGILPDMRYFIPVYAPLSLVSFSILSRVYKIDYDHLIKRYAIAIVINVFLFTAALVLIASSESMIFGYHINTAANIIAFLIFMAVLVIFINYRSFKSSRWIDTTLMFMVTLPVIWQVFISTAIIKTYSYPLFIPLFEILRKVLFGI
jgi:hypothetical protein